MARKLGWATERSSDIGGRLPLQAPPPGRTGGSVASRMRWPACQLARARSPTDADGGQALAQLPQPRQVGLLLRAELDHKVGWRVQQADQAGCARGVRQAG